MSMATLEREIVDKIRVFLNNPKFKKKDLLAWCTSDDKGVQPRNESEIKVYLPSLDIFFCCKKSLDKRGK